MPANSGRITGARSRRSSSVVDQSSFPAPAPVQATPNTRLRKFKKIRDKHLKRDVPKPTTMTDVQEVNETAGSGGETTGEARLLTSQASSTLKNLTSSHEGVDGNDGSRLLTNGQSSSTDGVTNGVSNGVGHSLSSEENIVEEENASTVEVEEVSDRDLGLEIYPDDVIGLDDVEGENYVVYDELTQSESASLESDRLILDPVDVEEDEYREFGEEEPQENIVIEEVHIPQAETEPSSGPSSETIEIKETVDVKETQDTSPELSAYYNPYAVSGRRAIYDTNEPLSNRKRKWDYSDEVTDSKRRLNDSTTSGSSWSPGWRFWSVATPQSPSTEGDSMLVNVDARSPQQSFSTGSSESDVSFTSKSHWSKYCNLM